jgi:Na+-driven multidrug efflux pump
MTTILAGAYGGVQILSAWVSIQSVMLTCYFFGVGFGNTMRTYVGIKLGKKRFQEARQIAVWATGITFFFMAPFCLAIGLLNKQGALFFTRDEKTILCMRINIVFYAIATPFDACYPIFGSLLRSLNLIWVNNLGSNLNCVVMGTILMYLGFWVFDWGPWTPMIAFN